MNSTSRYYLEPHLWSTDNLSLTGDEAHHCTRVLRSKLGDHVEVFDGNGRSVVGEIITLEKDNVVISPLSDIKTSIQAHKIHLHQAIPKGGNMELIVQKAVELGISEIQPLITTNTVARAEQLKKKQAKWQRIALEACKQCGLNFLPNILPTLSYAEWLEQQSINSANSANTDDSLKVVAALHPESIPFHNAFTSASTAQNAHLLVGPEGDFSDEEYSQAIAANFQPVSLGDIILRVETATIFCISIIKHELEKIKTN